MINCRIVPVAIIFVGAVQHEIVRASAVTVHGHVTERPGRIAGAVRLARRAWHVNQQFCVVAPIDRERLHLAALERTPQRVRSRLHQRQRLARHFHCLGKSPGLQRHVGPPFAGNFYVNSRHNGGLESALFHRHAVIPDGQLRHSIAAVVGGRHFAGQPRVRILYCHFGAAHCRSGRVRHGAENCPSESLSLPWASAEKQQCRHAPKQEAAQPADFHVH